MVKLGTHLVSSVAFYFEHGGNFGLLDAVILVLSDVLTGIRDKMILKFWGRGDVSRGVRRRGESEAKIPQRGEKVG